ncbi:MAG: argininosuccinate lyase [Nitrososphaerales archaeon]
MMTESYNGYNQQEQLQEEEKQSVVEEMKESSKSADKDILRAGRLGVFSPSAAKYTSSIDIDGRLLSSVVAINSAHVIMLYEQGILDQKIAGELLQSLRKVPKHLEMKEALEDVHMNVEDYLISKVGKDIGGMLNLGKSRNDQVATALRMALREELILLGNSILTLEKALLTQTAKNADSPMPGYTHLQRGQPVTLGHHLLAHFDALDRDFSRFVDCYLRVNLSPMGAGALASTGFDIDRERVAQLLGFDSVLENSLDAVSSRDFISETIFVCSQVMTDLSRLAEEIILWTTKEFSFAEISDKHASTSSMMPQKKNAIVPEIFRAKTSQVLGDLMGALGLLKALPLSYNLDLQELTRNLWSAMDKTTTSVRVLAELIDEMKFNVKVLLSATSSDDFMYATELADYLVSKFKLSFRDAHGRVGRLVKYASIKVEDSNQLKNLTSEEIAKNLGVEIPQSELEMITSPTRTLERRKAIGSPNPKLVLRASRKRLQVISQHEKTIQSLYCGLLDSEKLLSSSVDRIRKNSGTKSGYAVRLSQRDGEQSPEVKS